MKGLYQLLTVVCHSFYNFCFNSPFHFFGSLIYPTFSEKILYNIPTTIGIGMKKGMDSKLKIALLTGEYPPMQGGVGAFTQRLAQTLHAQGAEVSIITTQRAWPVTVERNWANRHESIDLEYGRLFAITRRWEWRDAQAVVDLLMRHPHDILNIQYQPAAYNLRNPAINILPWRLRGVIPTVVTFHDLREPYLFPKAGKIRSWLVRWMAKQAQGVIVTNSADYRVLQPLLSNPLTQIPIGSNVQTYPVSAEKVRGINVQLGVSADGLLLGYFGFLNASKGGDELIDALAKLAPSVHVVFIGGQTGDSDPTNEPFLTQLKEKIVQLGLEKRVHWTGFIDDEQVSAYLKACDLIVLPYRDGVSIRRGTLMAALAHGCAIITTMGNDSAESDLPPDSVHTVPPNDADALVSAINNLWHDYFRRLWLGKNAEQASKLFEWERIGKLSAEFYQLILDNPKKTP